jgi:hypothetical protein
VLCLLRTYIPNKLKRRATTASLHANSGLSLLVANWLLPKHRTREGSPYSRHVICTFQTFRSYKDATATKMLRHRRTLRPSCMVGLSRLCSWKIPGLEDRRPLHHRAERHRSLPCDLCLGKYRSGANY